MSGKGKVVVLKRLNQGRLRERERVSSIEDGEQKRVLDGNDMLVMVPLLSHFFLSFVRKTKKERYLEKQFQDQLLFSRE